MFFFFSKIISPLISPASLVFLLLAGGLLVAVRWRRAGNTLIILSATLFFIFGIMPTGHNLVRNLEQVTSKPEPMPETITGILVLGGGVETAASEASGAPEVNDNVDRILSGISLSRRYPEAKLVFSGGSGLLTRQDLRESAVIRQLLKNLGISDGGFLFEEKSRNTYENILYTRDLVDPEPQDKWILVTSAYHMRRSIAIAHHLNWNLLPYPVDYRTAGDYVFFPERYDVLRSLYLSELALREWIGVMAYRLTGKL